MFKIAIVDEAPDFGHLHVFVAELNKFCEISTLPHHPNQE